MTPADEIAMRVFIAVTGVFATILLIMLIAWIVLRIVAIGIEVLSDAAYDVKLAWKNAFGNKEDKEE